MPLEILLVGPLLALAVLALIAVAADIGTLRAQPTVRPARAGRARTAGGDEEFGLLRTVALSADLAAARAVRDRLMALGIRATVGTDSAGFARVLVFGDEYEDARDAV
ncbi:hypothetical protein [Virgisporangium aurantiacum]|uniref:Uncharacterized protein n=1 Tax=Virgisporangium aurantiacum TaxID=175570 RepID=A0A8J3YYU7_9ACTN|nr:hypothetical protein [Virgisporangium aurantiacum]GIJ53177.1 hypothetical protein Vau01_006930 [Virgisporangium aurantiacum]